MPITILALLALVAFLITIAHAVGKAPLWPAVLVLALALLVQTTGLR